MEDKSQYYNTAPSKYGSYLTEVDESKLPPIKDSGRTDFKKIADSRKELAAQAATGPFRGKDPGSFTWLERALDPSTSTLTSEGGDSESIRTMSANSRPDGMGAELLFPTIRYDSTTDKLVRLSPEKAYEKAMLEDDFLSFDSPDRATEFSKYLSDDITNRRVAFKEQELKKAKLKAESNSSVPTPAHLPDEVVEKYHGLWDFLREASLSPVSAEAIHTVIQWIEEEENIFNAEDGIYPRMDLLREYPSKTILDENGQPKMVTLLEELNHSFPVTNSSPGADILKEYLKDKWVEENRSIFEPTSNIFTNTWNVAGKLKHFGVESGKETGKFILDLPEIGNNIGYGVMETVALASELILNPPGLQPLNTYLSFYYQNVDGLSSEEAKKKAEVEANKLFKWKTYVGERLKPETEAGKAVAMLGEYGAGWFGGQKVIKWLGPKVLKWGKKIKKAVPDPPGYALTKSQTGFKSVKESKAIEAARKAGDTTKASLDRANKRLVNTLGPTLGTTVTVAPANRLLPFLEDMGMPPELARLTAEAPDDTTFMRYWKSFVDANADIMGINAVADGMYVFGRAMYYWSKPLTAESIKLAKEGLGVASSYFDKLKWLYPEEAINRKPRIKSGIEETLADLRVKSERELKALLKADKSGEILQELDKRGFGIGVDETGKQIIVPKALVPKTPKGKVDTLEIPEAGIEDVSVIPKVLTEQDKVIIAEQVIKDASEFKDTTHTMFNVDKVTTDQDQLNYIKKAASIFEAFYTKGRKTNKQTFKDAERIRREVEAWVGPENFGSYLEKFAGMTKSFPALMHSVRMYMFEEAKYFARSSQKITDLGLNATKKDLANFYLDVYKYIRAMETDVRISGNIARTQQVRNTILGASDNVLDNVLKAAAWHGESGEQGLLQIARLVSATDDPLGIANLVIRRKGPLYHTFEILKNNAVTGYISGAVTQVATHLGVLNWATTRQFEHLPEIFLNAMAREYKDRTGRAINLPLLGKVFGEGEGMTMSAWKSEAFGLNQALWEIVGGAHFRARGPVGSAIKAGKNLQAESFAKGQHELASSSVGGSGVTMKLPFGKNTEIALSRGMTEEIFGNYLDTPFMKGEEGQILKYLVNASGLLNTAQGRGIIMSDGFWRNVIERTQLNKFAKIQATKTIRDSLRNADGTLKITDKKEFFRRVEEEYQWIVRNPDYKLLERVRKETQIGLMQKPGEKYLFGKNPLQGMEDFKNKTSDRRAGKDWLVDGTNQKGESFTDLGESAKNVADSAVQAVPNIIENTARSFVAASMPFLRTMTNINTQYAVNRSPLKFLDMMRPEWQKKWKSGDDVFRNEVLAQLGFGTMVVSAGVGLGARFFQTDGAGFYIEGLDASDPSTRYIKYSEGGRSPEISYQDGKGNEYSISLDRIDSGRASLALGAIFGDTYNGWQEAIELMDVHLQEEAIEEEERLSQRLRWALSDWIFSMPMAEGVKGIAGSVFPISSFGIDPYGPDMMREPVKFVQEFLNPFISTQSSLRKSIVRTKNPFAFMGQKGEKRQIVEKDPEAKIWDFRMGERKDDRLTLTRKADILFNAMNDYIEAEFKVSIMDTTDLRNPKVGQNLYGLVGPEGDLVKFFPHLKIDSINRALSTLFLPITTRYKIGTNTGDLSLALEVPYEDPRKWQATPGIALTAEQRYHWAVEAGRLNKQFFTKGIWPLEVGKLNAGKYDDKFNDEDRQYKAKLKMRFHAQLLKNRERAYIKMYNHKRNYRLRYQIRQQERVNSLKQG